MPKSISVNKQELIDLLNRGLTTREIGSILGKHNSYVSYLIHKWDLLNMLAHKCPDVNQEYFSGKITTKEQAYSLGFFIADGSLNQDGFSITTAIQDEEVMLWFCEQLGSNIHYDLTFDKATRRYPNCYTTVGHDHFRDDLHRLFGGYLKVDRRLPIISKALDPFLLQGFFDADGCITWGIRKDRNRVWQKVSFNSSYKLLSGIQNILLNMGFSSKIKPKGTEKCFLLELASKENVLALVDFIYSDPEFLPMKRKYQKFVALRLELGEFGERNQQHRAEPPEEEGVETSSTSYPSWS